MSSSPTVVDEMGMVEDGDSIIFFNFRPDRAREGDLGLCGRDFREFATKPLQVRMSA